MTDHSISVWTRRCLRALVVLICIGSKAYGQPLELPVCATSSSTPGGVDWQFFYCDPSTPEGAESGLDPNATGPQRAPQIPSYTGDGALSDHFLRSQRDFFDQLSRETEHDFHDLIYGIGDPISPDGDFIYSQTDLSLPGIGSDFEFTRTYRSRAIYLSILGRNWDHSYDQRLYWIQQGSCAGIIEYHDGRFGAVRFREVQRQGSEITFSPDSGIGLALRYDSNIGAYILRDGTGIEHLFSGPPLDSDQTFATSPGPSRPLTGIRDLLGHQQIIVWAPGDEGFQHPRILYVLDTLNRKIFFNYAQSTKGDYFLACLAFDDGCNHAVAAFAVDQNVSAPSYGELIASTDVNGIGQSYRYLNGFAEDNSPNGIPTSALVPLCKKLCGRKSDDCSNADICSSGSSYCRFAGLQSAGDCKRNCDLRCTLDNEIVSHAQLLFQCETDCTTSCRSVVDRVTIQCAADFVGLVPYCKGFPPAGVCADRCVDHYTPLGRDGSPRLSFGQMSDLNHNLIEIKDGIGRVVLSNSYGTDPTLISFDRVISQTLGEVGSVDSSITVEYHDLALEREFVQSGQIMVADHAVKTAPGAIDPAHVSSLDMFNSVEVCPTVSPFGWEAANTIVGPAKEPQLPAFASVTHDLHGVTRTIYLDKDKRILRHVTFARGSTDIYETVDFNYRMQPNGLDRAIRLAAGNRFCMYVENTLDQNTLIAELPAPGLPGETLPRITINSYDSNGLTTGFIRTLGGFSKEMKILRDPQTSRVNSIVDEVGGGEPALVTVLQYQNSTDPIPSTIVNMDGSITVESRCGAVALGSNISVFRLFRLAVP